MANRFTELKQQDRSQKWQSG